MTIFHVEKLRLGVFTMFPPRTSEHVPGLGPITGSSVLQTCDFSLMRTPYIENRGESQLGIYPVDEVVVGASVSPGIRSASGECLHYKRSLSCFITASSLCGCSWRGRDTAGPKSHLDSSHLHWEQLIIRRACKWGKESKGEGSEGERKKRAGWGGEDRKEGTEGPDGLPRADPSINRHVWHYVTPYLRKVFSVNNTEADREWLKTYKLRLAHGRSLNYINLQIYLGINCIIHPPHLWERTSTEWLCCAMGTIQTIENSLFPNALLLKTARFHRCKWRERKRSFLWHLMS